MIYDKIIMSTIYGHLFGFYYNDNKVQAIKCYDEDSLIGNIYVGRVSNIAKNINAAFVDIDAKTSCYLPLEDLDEPKIRIGDSLLVQVIKDGIKTKKPTVTTNISLTGNNLILQKNSMVGVSNKITSNHVRNSLKNTFIDFINNKYKNNDTKYGCIIRTAAEKNSLNNFVDEIDYLSEKLDFIINNYKFYKPYYCIYKNDNIYLNDIKNNSFNEIITDISDVYNCLSDNKIDNIKLYDDPMIELSSLYSLKSVIDKALKKNVYMKSGAYLVIEPTEAMTVIDVNSGKSIKGSNNQEALFKINIEAAHEIARQLKIRNISGIIIVDFISMKDDDNNLLLLHELKKAVESDYIPVQIVDITRLGLVEITRKKINKSIYQIFLDNNDCQ